MNKSGKTLTIFLFVIAVLLVSLTAIAVFFFLKEVDLRKSAEYNLAQMRTIDAKLQAELKETLQQSNLLKEKNKEVEDRIENLLEELDLEKGLRDEIKKENKELQEAVQKAAEEKAQLQEKFGVDLSKAEEKIVGLQEKLAAALQEKAILSQRGQGILQEPEGVNEGSDGTFLDETPALENDAPEETVDLEKIVVNPAGGKTGKVISVDQETEFLIVDLGEKDGVKVGSLISIYRGQKLLGDVAVSRVLPEMSAADLVPPLTTQTVRKGDGAVIKE